jgi:hypothetical protein
MPRAVSLGALKPTLSGFFVCKELVSKVDTRGMHIQQEPQYLKPTRQWCLVLICSLAMSAAGMAQAHEASDDCWVADFREMSLTTHDVQVRERKALEWLRQRAGQCNEEQLLMISSNRPSWLGNADTARVAAQIDRVLEKRYLMNQRNVSDLFDSETNREQTTEAITSPAAPTTVVPPTQSTESPAAVIVQPTP